MKSVPWASTPTPNPNSNANSHRSGKALTVSNADGGVERLLNFIETQLEQLIASSTLERSDFATSESLRLVTERRLEITAQACVDVAHRILASLDHEGVRTGAGAIEQLGQIGVIPAPFATRFKPIAQFRNVLAHLYVELDWDIVYSNLQQLDDIEDYLDHIREWLQRTE